MCCPYTHWSMVKLPVAKPLKETEFYLTLPGAIICEDLHFSISSTIFQSPLQCCCLDCFFWGWRQGEIVTYAFDVSPSQLGESGVIDTTAKEASLLPMISSSIDHGLSHGLW